MYGFVRKFGKTKTFSNLVVQLKQIFFSTALVQTRPSVSTLIKYTTNKPELVEHRLHSSMC